MHGTQGSSRRPEPRAESSALPAEPQALLQRHVILDQLAPRPPRDPARRRSACAPHRASPARRRFPPGSACSVSAEALVAEDSTASRAHDVLALMPIARQRRHRRREARLAPCCGTWLRPRRGRPWPGSRARACGRNRVRSTADRGSRRPRKFCFAPGRPAIAAREAQIAEQRQLGEPVRLALADLRGLRGEPQLRGADVRPPPEQRRRVADRTVAGSVGRAGAR